MDDQSSVTLQAALVAPGPQDLLAALERQVKAFAFLASVDHALKCAQGIVQKAAISRLTTGICIADAHLLLTKLIAYQGAQDECRWHWEHGWHWSNWQHRFSRCHRRDR